MSFDLWWKVAKSINFYVVKAFFAARQIWLQSFFTPKHEVGWRNPFLWAIWPYAEGPSTIAIASFFSHWEKHYYYCSSAMHFSTLEILLSLCVYVYYVLVLHTKLQNSDVLKGFFNLFFDESYLRWNPADLPSPFRNWEVLGEGRKDWKNASKMPKNPS